MGSAPDRTTRAVSSSPLASVTPQARPPATRIRATGAPVRTRIPCARPAAAIASVIAPIPPITCPKKPCTASSPPVSRWKSSPIRVPGWYGPPCLPYRLLASSRAFACRDSNRASMNWPRLPVSIRVRPSTSVPRSPRRCRPTRSTSLTRRTPVARVSGGSSMNRGCSRDASRRSSSCTWPNARASAGEYRAIPAAVRAGSFQSARTSPSSRATWRAGSQGTMRSPCAPRSSARITSGRSMLAM